MTMQHLILCFSLLLLYPASAFVHHCNAERLSVARPKTSGLHAEEDDDNSAVFESAFPGAQILDVLLMEHKPLGCTVEESLGDTMLKPVFVSKVVTGGFADQAGIKVGDVIVGTTGIFGGLTNVLGKGIEQVTTAVAGRTAEDPLEFRIARGTNVKAMHDTALVDLCASVGADDQEIEECVVDFLQSTYGAELEYNDEPVEAEEETDELLENVFENLWGDEMQEMLPEKQVENATPLTPPEPKKKETKAMPWRSRSSPSGTFVRDPKTGKMTNIDAKQ